MKDKDQVLYEGRWIDKKDFRVMLYSKTDSLLVKSIERLNELKESGEWFESEAEAKEVKEVKTRKKREKVVELLDESYPENALGDELNGTDG